MSTKQEQLEELEALIARIKRHQEALGLSPRDFVARYNQYLTSERTWTYRLLEGKYEEVSISKTLPRLRAMVAELDGGSPVENVWEDLPVYRDFYVRYRLLTGRKSDRRVIVMLANEGAGKSVCARHTCAKHPKETAYVVCRPTWKNRELQILRGISRVIGVEERVSSDDQLDSVVEKLKAEPKTIFIDEAHDGGVVLLKIIKTLVNETPCRFVILAYPTLWRRVVLASDDAHAEARQLMRRTIKPIFDTYAKGTTAEDVEIYLKKCLGFNGHAKDVARSILPVVRPTAICPLSPTSSTWPTPPSSNRKPRSPASGLSTSVTSSPIAPAAAAKSPNSTHTPQLATHNAPTRNHA
ncbi:AAA family ATPase [Cerasicoccus maritimus]|uniref:AAA family ATPase n=1 Tax=Cerasicoccus maritimus TaxID=490089 RepID=UPI0028526DD9|nr:AAA family ATPase [Cerasicoccus maritimus]